MIMVIMMKPAEDSILQVQLELLLGPAAASEYHHHHSDEYDVHNADDHENHDFYADNDHHDDIGDDFDAYLHKLLQLLALLLLLDGQTLNKNFVARIMISTMVTKMFMLVTVMKMITKMLKLKPADYLAQGCE